MTIDQVKSLTAIAESAAKVVALVVGGSWTYMLFIRKRQQYPRASVTQECAAYPLTPDRSLLRVTLTVKNTSDVLLRIESGEVRVQQVIPVAATATFPDGFAGADDELEYSWPEIGCRTLAYSTDGCLEVEPGESEGIDLDLFVPPDVRVVQIYTYLKNVTKTDREIGWRCTSIHQLAPRPAAERVFE